MERSKDSRKQYRNFGKISFLAHVCNKVQIHTSDPESGRQDEEANGYLMEKEVFLLTPHLSTDKGRSVCG